jgi:antitoxin HigA-1
MGPSGRMRFDSFSVVHSWAYVVVKMTKEPLSPTHPGEILRAEFMIPHELSSNALARLLGVTAARVNEIAQERRGITADTALRLARCFSTTPQFWMNLQVHYELEVASRTLGNTLSRLEALPMERVVV